MLEKMLQNGFYEVALGQWWMITGNNKHQSPTTQQIVWFITQFHVLFWCTRPHPESSLGLPWSKGGDLAHQWLAPRWALRSVSGRGSHNANDSWSLCPQPPTCHQRSRVTRKICTKKLKLFHTVWSFGCPQPSMGLPWYPGAPSPPPCPTPPHRLGEGHATLHHQRSSFPTSPRRLLHELCEPWATRAGTDSPFH